MPNKTRQCTEGRGRANKREKTRGSETTSGLDEQGLLPNGSEERGVLLLGSIAVGILPSCQ